MSQFIPQGSVKEQLPHHRALSSGHRAHVYEGSSCPMSRVPDPHLGQGAHHRLLGDTQVL